MTSCLGYNVNQLLFCVSMTNTKLFTASKWQKPMNWSYQSKYQIWFITSFKVEIACYSSPRITSCVKKMRYINVSTVQSYNYTYKRSYIFATEDNPYKLQDDGHFICLVTYIDAQALSNLHFGWIYGSGDPGKSDFILVRLSSSINPASKITNDALSDLFFLPFMQYSRVVL